MQHAGGCLIHKLYTLTFSVATRPLSAFAGRDLVVKQRVKRFPADQIIYFILLSTSMYEVTILNLYMHAVNIKIIAYG